MARFVLSTLVLAALVSGCRALAPAGPEARAPAGLREEVLLSQETEAGSVRLAQRVRKQTYQIDGADAPQLRAALDATPARAADGHFDATTTWALTWSFRYQRAAACELAAASVTLEVVITVPEAAAPEALDETTRERWGAYLAALEAHELGHAERALAASEDLASAFASSGPHDDCSALGAALNATGAAHLEALAAANRQYDIDTRHGRSHGAVFP
jgi:predicted secreted Zn-dependent protease